jgi:hypothetical protein
MSFLRVRRKDSNLRFYTLLRDNAHSNILSIFSESSTRRPELDELVLVPGLLGAYPNAFFHIEEEQLLEFARKVSLLGSEADYTELRDLFGIRRGDSRFWKYADRLHRDAPLYDGQVAGLFDFNRLENR